MTSQRAHETASKPSGSRTSTCAWATAARASPRGRRGTGSSSPRARHRSPTRCARSWARERDSWSRSARGTSRTSSSSSAAGPTTGRNGRTERWCSCLSSARAAGTRPSRTGRSWTWRRRASTAAMRWPGAARLPLGGGARSRRYTRPSMAHVFVAPHPNVVALSCGGLIASLRELGQNVTILTVFSGSGSGEGLSPYQREALGFGSKAHWPSTEAFNRADILPDYPIWPAWLADDEALEATQVEADQAAKRFWQRSSWYRRASIRAESLAGQPVIDDLPTQGAILTEEVVDAATTGDLMARRRLEDERFTYFSEASVVFLDLPDAVFRGYEDDAQLLGSPRSDDTTPFDLLRQEIVRLEPQKVYLPLGVGGHVD